MWESSHWLGKTIVQSTVRKKPPGKHGKVLWPQRYNTTTFKPIKKKAKFDNYKKSISLTESVDQDQTARFVQSDIYLRCQQDQRMALRSIMVKSHLPERRSHDVFVGQGQQ